MSQSSEISGANFALPDLQSLPETPIDSPVDALLDRFAHFGVELGLERIQRLLQALGNPHTQLPVIHVAGSNGKGSVCAYLSAVLTHAGYRVGRYISPHLVDWTERISINETAITPEAFYHALQTVIAAIDRNFPSPTQFEVVTAAAWLYFAQQQVDVAIMEVGLGGRLDATNVCDRPLVSVITSLSMEHWQRLGPTLADITREKAGILKPGCPAVIAPQPEAAQAVLQHQLARLNCPVTWVQPALAAGEGWAEFWDIPPVTATPSHTKPMASSPAQSEQSEPLKYHLPLGGAHQRINSAVAIATLRILQAQGWPLSNQIIVEGIAKTRWPGRMQWLTWQDRPLLIDGAHNPAGAEMLRQYVDESNRTPSPISWVIGMMGNKDHADLLRALLRKGDRLYLVPVPGHLTANIETLTNLAHDLCPQLASVADYPDERQAITAADRENATGTLVLCGSLYLIGHFLRHATPTTPQSYLPLKSQY
ncbi:bifunctional folylpolyglutamate synthase/dihydrofolate synthase [Vacuolonema iberomarrocanum]|uniref:bifunctional folylpolyglutamate synthase/dihydrofolate synthase n=1 Tax=Vacuolonema iberomarrocanum TaxID=3454632 RepID=UPI0019DDA41A|nr:bifunctional folylpolyglutamate synthase/dihydrofolate synthase [filamentous cyanobacterium LEGE 07170]